MQENENKKRWKFGWLKKLDFKVKYLISLMLLLGLLPLPYLALHSSRWSGHTAPASSCASCSQAVSSTPSTPIAPQDTSVSSGESLNMISDLNTFFRLLWEESLMGSSTSSPSKSVPSLPESTLVNDKDKPSRGQRRSHRGHQR